MRQRAQQIAAAVLFLVLSAGVYFQRVHIERPSHYGLVNVDLIHHGRPTAIFSRSELLQGRIPLWNPYQQAGVPYLATQIPSVLYPPNLALLRAFPADRALELHTILHWAIAGLFTWLFAGRLGLGPLPRVVAALVYMFSGDLLFALYSSPFGSSLAWLPAVLWALDGLMREVRPGWCLALAVTLSLSFLGGHTQAFFHVVGLALIYALFALVHVTPAGSRARAVALGVSSGVVALGLVAPQLLPSLELLTHSVRSFQSIPPDGAAFPALSVKMLVTGMFGWVGSHILGPAGILWAPGSRVVQAPPLQYVASIPMLTLPLVAAGFAARRQRAVWCLFVALAVVIALYMVGPATPVFSSVHWFFLGGLFRGAARVSFVYVFLAAMLVGIGVEGLQQGFRAGTTARRAGRVAAVLVALLCAAGVYSRTRLWEALPAVEPPYREPSELVRTLRASADDGRVFIQPYELGLRQTPQGWRELIPGAGTRDDYLVRKLGQMHRILAVSDYEPLSPAAYQTYFDAPREGAIPWHGQVSLLRGDRLAPRAQQLLRLLDVMSVRLYVVPRSVGVETLDALEALVGSSRRAVGPFEILERTQAPPRAYVATDVRRAADIGSALLQIRQESFDPSRSAVLVGETLTPLPRFLAPGSARVTASTPRRVEVEATCEGPCLVVLTDLHYPGWIVAVEGSEREMLRINGIFRGVLVGEGEREIAFRYEPRSFDLGLRLCGVSVLLAAVLLLAPLRRGVARSREAREPGRAR